MINIMSHHLSNYLFKITDPDTKPYVINHSPLIAPINLPIDFSIKVLNTSHLEEIYNLINNHYADDNHKIYRQTFSKDYIYWYLKYIPAGFVIGLLYKEKLVGMIATMFIDMIIFNQKLKVPYGGLLCIQKKLRGYGLSKLLITEIGRKLSKINLNYVFFSSQIKFDKSFSSVQNYVVPINCAKLQEVNFLTEHFEPVKLFDTNPLRLVTGTDIETICVKLNKSLTNYKVKPWFSKDAAYHYILPKKNIVYSFVIEIDGEITDFINVYQNFYFCYDSSKTISVANLGFYFCESIELTELVTLLIDKLRTYDFDQLVIKNYGQNSKINTTKFASAEENFYYMHNMGIPYTDPNEFMFFPF